MQQKVIAGLVVLVGVLAGFYGGAKYGATHTTASAASTGTATSSTNRSATGASPGAGARAGAGAGAGGFGAPAAAGQIVAAANGTITVHDRATGKDVKVNVGSARISKTVQGSAADLTQNQTVTVSGQTGSDGTVNAQVIAVGAGLGGRARPSPST
jgi:hypothetical protein